MTMRLFASLVAASFVSLAGAKAALRKQTKWSDSHSHEELDRLSAEMEAQTKTQIVSTSMQDYLGQLSELQMDNPTVAIPGQWLTDQKSAFLFLPIKVPKGMPLDDLKMLTNGQQLLVNVVERPADRPEDAATKKFRLVMDAFKTESAGDSTVLNTKLQEWYQSEDNSEVRNLVKETIDDLQKTDGTKKAPPQAVNIPLNTLELGSLRELIAAAHTTTKAKGKDRRQQQFTPKIANPHGGVATIKLKGTYLQQSAATSKQAPSDATGGPGMTTGEPSLITVPLDAEFLQTLVNKADYLVPLSNDRVKNSVIKETFSVQIPYPVAPNRIFAVLAANGEVVVTMPYNPQSTKAKGSDPFNRVPVFDMQGHKLVGPGPTAATLDPESAEVDKKVTVKEAATAEKPKAATSTPPKASAKETREGAVLEKKESSEVKVAASALAKSNDKKAKK